MAKSSRLQTDETSIALLKQDVSYIKETVSKIESNLEAQYATKDQLSALKDVVDWHSKIFWAIMSLIIVVIGGAILTSVLKFK